MTNKPHNRSAKINFKNDATIPDGASPVTFQRDTQGNLSGYVVGTSGGDCSCCPSPVVVTLAGQPEIEGFDNGIGFAATFQDVNAIWGDGTFLYIADGQNLAIRKYNIATGEVTTFNAEFSTYSIWGDGTYLYAVAYIDGGGPATGTLRRMDLSDGTVSTVIFEYADIVLDAGQTSFVAGHMTGDANNLYLCFESAGTGTKEKIYKAVLTAGTIGTPAFLAGDLAGWADGTGAAAKFDIPKGMQSDGTYLYACDGNKTIRKITIATGEVVTISGTAYEAFAGSPTFAHIPDGIGAEALWDNPRYMWADADFENLYITESYGPTIRKLNLTTLETTTIAGVADVENSPPDDGNPAVFGYLDGDVSIATFEEPGGIWGQGADLYVTDFKTELLRRIGCPRGLTTSVLIPSVATLTFVNGLLTAVVYA